MKRQEKRELAALLRTLDTPEARAAAEQLERGPGRPARPPEERAWSKIKRVLVAEALYHGTFPAHLLPESYEALAAAAKGSRTEAQALAGELLGVSASTVESARRGRLDSEATLHLKPDELAALVRIIATGKLPGESGES